MAAPVGEVTSPTRLGKRGKGALAFRSKESLAGQLLLQGFELCLQQSLSTALNQANDHLILSARLVDGHNSEGSHVLAIRDLHSVQSRRGAAEKDAGKLAGIVLEGEILMPRGLPAVV